MGEDSSVLEEHRQIGGRRVFLGLEPEVKPDD